MNNFQWGLAAWGLRETPLVRQLEMACRFDVKLLELGIGGHENDFIQFDATAGRIAECRAMFAAAGCRLDCGSTGNDFTQADEKAVMGSLSHVRRALELAGELGCRYLRIFAGFSPVAEVTGERYERQIDCLRSAYMHGKRCGVLPVIETHGGVAARLGGACHHSMSTTTSVEALRRMFADLPELRLNFDPANLYAAGVDPVAFCREFKEKIVYMHLKDFFNLSGTDAWLPAACGESPMDWPALLNQLKEFDGPALMEYEIPADVESGFKRSFDYMHKQEAYFG